MAHPTSLGVGSSSPINQIEQGTQSLVGQGQAEADLQFQVAFISRIWGLQTSGIAGIYFHCFLVIFRP